MGLGAAAVFSPGDAQARGALQWVVVASGVDPPVLAALQVGGVDPRMWPPNVDWLTQAGVDALVGLRAQSANRALCYAIRGK